MKNVKIINEQNDGWEKLPDSDQKMNPLERIDKYKNFEIKQENGVWYKKTKTNVPPPSTGDYSCIENFNKANGYKELGFAKNPENRQEQGKDHNGRKTALVYTKNKTVVWWYDDGNKEKIKKGTWECTGNDSYTMKWEDGKIQKLESTATTQTNTATTQTNTATTQTTQSLYKQVNFTGEDILNNNANIKQYMRGDIVKKIQDYLKKLGFGNVSKSGRSDGDYGELTKKAVEDYQASTNGQLVADGIVGDKTWTRMVQDVLKKETKVPQEIDVSDEISVDDDINSIEY
jgi:hypothetical protein